MKKWNKKENNEEFQDNNNKQINSGLIRNVVIVIITFLAILVFISLKFFIFAPREIPKLSKEDRMQFAKESPSLRREIDEVNKKYPGKIGKDGKIHYNEEDLKTGYYSDNTIDVVIPDSEVEKIKAGYKYKMAELDFSGAEELILNESLKYNSAKSKKFKQEIVPLLEDLSIMSNLEYSAYSDTETTKENLNSIKSNENYFYALMALNPDFRDMKYVLDADSIEPAISDTIIKVSKGKVQLLEPFKEIEKNNPYYKKASRLMATNIKKIYGSKFNYLGDIFETYIIIDENNHRFFLGNYGTDANSNNLTTVRQWQKLTKEKTDMHNPAKSIWQEGGPRDDISASDEDNLLPFSDKVEEEIEDIKTYRDAVNPRVEHEKGNINLDEPDDIAVMEQYKQSIEREYELKNKKE